MTHTALPSSAVEQDYIWMAEAIKLARRGRYTTSPNPRVGCVILDSQGNLAGQGAHLQAGTPHAEVHALQQAGARAAGGTAYVTLEPCSHYGRTPPCAEALVKAGVARVVIAMTDPNPQVSGRGIEKLQQAGIEVVSDILAAQAAALNRGFIKRMVTQKPFVTVKLAASLDGKIALTNGQSQWITGPQARRDVQHYRAASCAVLTGSGTALADNPSLLVRPEQAGFTDYPLAEIRQPVRVVVDSKARLPDALQLFSDGFETWRMVGDDMPGAIKHVPVPLQNGKLDLSAMLTMLAQRNINEVWVEAGPELAGALLLAGEVDELIVYQAPKLLGDKGRSMVSLGELTSLYDAIELCLTEQVQVGQDIRLTYQVRHLNK